MADLQSLLRSGSAYLDLWKLGWGTAYLDSELDDKLALLAAHSVAACPGGTLLEIAGRQGRTGECLDWFQSAGFSWVEVSDGLGELSPTAKGELIARTAERFTVISEVGAKDPAVAVDVDSWVRAVVDDLDAGARLVIAEGRESGTVGIYRRDGSVREALVDALVVAVGVERLVFEAPRKDQQAWFIRHLGPAVNLANVAPRQLLGLEALRLGLRADTVEVGPTVATAGRSGRP